MENRKEIDDIDTKIQHGNEMVSEVVRMVGWMKENLDYVQETLMGTEVDQTEKPPAKNPFYVGPGGQGTRERRCPC